MCMNVLLSVLFCLFDMLLDRSGRIINIVVSPAAGYGNKDTLRLLNYLTAPNVVRTLDECSEFGWLAALLSYI